VAREHSDPSNGVEAKLPVEPSRPLRLVGEHEDEVGPAGARFCGRAGDHGAREAAPAMPFHGHHAFKLCHRLMHEKLTGARNQSVDQHAEVAHERRAPSRVLRVSGPVFSLRLLGFFPAGGAVVSWFEGTVAPFGVEAFTLPLVG
jgi:hypothetical protein